jgi:hypothetical protein
MSEVREQVGRDCDSGLGSLGGQMGKVSSAVYCARRIAATETRESHLWTNVAMQIRSHGAGRGVDSAFS